MKKVFYLCSVICCVMIFGCSSGQLSRTAATDLLSPAMGLAGGLIGMYAADGESLGTQMAAAGAGTVGAFLLGQFIENNFKDEKAKEYRAGYDLGRSNSAKELYWTYQKIHQAKEGENQLQMQVYELPVQYPNDGVKYMPDSIAFPVLK